MLSRFSFSVCPLHPRIILSLLYIGYKIYNSSFSCEACSSCWRSVSNSFFVVPKIRWETVRVDPNVVTPLPTNIIHVNLIPQKNTDIHPVAAFVAYPRTTKQGLLPRVTSTTPIDKTTRLGMNFNPNGYPGEEEEEEKKEMTHMEHIQEDSANYNEMKNHSSSDIPFNRDSNMTFHMDDHYENTTTTFQDFFLAAYKNDNPMTNVPSNLMIGAIQFYKNFISPLLPPACRFLPTCSQYGVQAIETFGPWKGLILILWRLLRCSPLGGCGYDPPQWPPVPYNYGRY